MIRHPDLLVGLEHHDDAGVFRLTPDLAVIQTVDYFTPIVDNPRDFGAIAAANSFSDVYAMGGEPLTAMNIVGFPTKQLELSVLRDVIEGGHEVIEEAGAVLVGGHSVKSPELFYGLAVLGRIHPDRVVTNAGAKPGDHLVLTKPVGTGILTTALKQGALSSELLGQVTAQMRRLNASAARAMMAVGAHGCTDITGYGLLGHLYELTSASGVDARVFSDRVPLLDGVLDLARAGNKPGGLSANRDHFGRHVESSEGIDAERVELLYDPQTSGGLLISLEPAKAQRLVETLRSGGDPQATVIGEVEAGTGRIQLLPSR